MTMKLDRIKAGFELLATDPQECYHSGCMEQIAKEGGPLLLAVAEAAAEYVTSVRREFDLPENLETDAELDDYERVLLRIDAAKDALVAAIAPLLEGG